DWFSSPFGSDGGVVSSTTTTVSGSHSSETEFTGESYGETDIPIMLPVPFKELSSVQFFTPEEQLNELTAALKEQFGRHCFIKIQHEKTQPLRVPFVESLTPPTENLLWYERRALEAAKALPAEVVDMGIANEERALNERAGIRLSRATEENRIEGSKPTWAD